MILKNPGRARLTMYVNHNEGFYGDSGALVELASNQTHSVIYLLVALLQVALQHGHIQDTSPMAL